MQISIKENETGYLLPLSLKELPFIPKRLFVVKNKMKDIHRGDHAHLNEEHFLICLHGTLKIKYETSLERGTFLLKTGQSYHQKELQWLNLNFLEENTTLLVFSDNEYDEKNYIRDYKVFKHLTNKKVD
jgi:hypothetical protein